MKTYKSRYWWRKAITDLWGNRYVSFSNENAWLTNPISGIIRHIGEFKNGVGVVFD